MADMTFTDHCLRANGLRERGFRAWVLAPGMRFGSHAVWWGGQAPRPRPHEGIDLYRYVDAAGTLCCLEPGIMIPALRHGTVVGIFPDFLGQSILMAHDQGQEGWRLYSIIAHAVAEPGIAVGQGYPAGTIVARLAQSQRPRVPAHLHITTLMSQSLPPQPLSWPLLASSGSIRLVDPEPYLGGPVQAPREIFA